MTALDMDVLTPAQRDVLSAIAINEDGGHNPRTLAVLERLGLIERQRVDAGGGLIVARWHVPIHVHMQWATWCAQQPDED